MSFPNVRAKNIAATGTLTVGGVGSATRLWSIVVNTGAASAVATVYDGTAATGTKIATINATAVASLNFGGSVCKDGVTLVLSGGNADITVNAG